MQQTAFIISVIIVLVIFYIFYKSYLKPKALQKKMLEKPFPANWKDILNERVLYYHNLPSDRKKKFEKRVQRFLIEKSISGIDTEINDIDKLLVASSAIIPVFNFPYFTYPNVKEILLYPGSFDQKFQTADSVEQRDILGMIGDGYMNGVVILS